MATVAVDSQVDNFTSINSQGETVSLADYAGKKLVVYFYPKDNTPGCTTEGQTFRDHYPAFQQANTEILGVSRDSVKTHANFKAKHNFPFELLSDKEEDLCKLFDVIKLKKMYGREYMGIERSTFLINEQGVLIKEWRKIKLKGHVEEVLAAAQEL